jgi:predicted small metal-binding protein
MIMGRKYMQCREQDAPGETMCSTTLSADSEEELLEAVISHGINVHGFANTPEFRNRVTKEFKDAP